jgi:hypothetical protein
VTWLGGQPRQRCDRHCEAQHYSPQQREREREREREKTSQWLNCTSIHGGTTSLTKIV